MMRLALINAAVLTSCLSLAHSALAEQGIDEMDSVLDRLEQRILERKRANAAPLLSDESDFDAPEDMTNLTAKEVQIKAELPETRELRALAKSLAKIESEVDRLVGDVQRATQKVIEHSRIDNFVKINATMKDPKHLVIRHLSISIDNFEVYRLNLSDGIYSGQNSIPLYAGPLEPGKHELRVEAKFTELQDDGLPLKKGAFGSVDKRFDIEVPTGAFNKTWDIQLVRETKGENYRLQLK